MLQNGKCFAESHALILTPEAVDKLGLKLEPRKVAVESVVVDQVFKTPTAN